MTGLFTDPVFFPIGTGDFLHSFFSTVAYRLENNNWGSRFPTLLNELYHNGIAFSKCSTALDELYQIKSELSTLSPDKVVWDSDDLTKQSPWGNHISSTITNLENYFVTSDGNNLIETFEKALKASIELEEKLIIRSI